MTPRHTVMRVDPQLSPQPLEYRAQRHGKAAGKAQVSLVLEFSHAIRGAAAILAPGAEKYGRKDWEKGMPKEEVIDSLMRHLLAYVGGEDLDPDTGLPHVDAVTCNALMLAEFRHTKKG
jgi:hypothetical protein